METKDKNYKFGFVHFVKYFWANLVIGWKITTEFKPNFYSAIIVEIIWGLTYSLFGFLFIENFIEILNWTYKDFLVFCFINT